MQTGQSHPESCFREYTSPCRYMHMTRFGKNCPAAVSALLAISISLCGCGNSGAVAPKTISLKGAGATFPLLAYSKWITEYKEARPNVSIEYRPEGSGAGIDELAAGQIDFAGSDMPLTDDQMSKFKQ